MPVPPFVNFWLPVLHHLADGEIRRPADLASVLADEFGLTREERAERIPSGRTRVLDRVLWTFTYLRQAGLIASPRRGEAHITDRGRSVLAEHPGRLDKTFLLQFPEFQAFMNRSRRDRVDKPSVDAVWQQTNGTAISQDLFAAEQENSLAPELSPEETMKRANDEMVVALAADLLAVVC